MSRSVADVLVAERLITADQLASARRVSVATSRPVLNILVEQGTVSTKDVVRCTVQAAGLQFVEIESVAVDPEASALLTRDDALRFNAIPIALESDVLVVVTDSRTAADPVVRAELESTTGRSVRFACALKTEIRSRVDKVYPASVSSGLPHAWEPEGWEPTTSLVPRPPLRSVPTPRPAREPEVEPEAQAEPESEAEEPEEAASELEAELGAESEPEPEPEPDAEPEPVVMDGQRQPERHTAEARQLSTMLAAAIDDNASDIHIEPTGTTIRVRFRIDGVLHERLAPPIELQPTFIQAIKALSGMEVAETNLPQDGHLPASTPGPASDVSVTSLPTVWGESIVIRLLESPVVDLTVEDLAMTPRNLEQWQSSYQERHGLLIVSGPSGSGRSTLLYATLTALIGPEVNIVTVEETVERRVSGISQVEINGQGGLTYPAALRSVLRADPDIVLIGDLRDRESAHLAIDLAQSGRLVLAAMHAQDAANAMTQVAQMGVEPFLLASTLNCVASQRLVRRLCTHCRHQVHLSQDEFDAVHFEVPSDVDPTLFEPIGCSECAGTGFRGRIAIQEVMPMTAEIVAATLRGAGPSELRLIAEHEGMRTLRQDGWLKVAAGTTTIGEVLRVTG